MTPAQSAWLRPSHSRHARASGTTSSPSSPLIQLLLASLGRPRVVHELSSLAWANAPCARVAQLGLRPAAEPLLAVLVNLLLPERHGLLEHVDRVLACRQRVLAMRRRDGDHDARLA